MKTTQLTKQILAAGLVIGLSLSAKSILPAIASFHPTNEPSSASNNPTELLSQGKALYQAGQFAEAVNVLQKAAEIYANEEDSLKQAIALSNLSLAYQKLGQWQPADEAIARSLNIVGNFNQQYQRISRLTAQFLEIYAHQQLQQGNPETALRIWREAAELYLKVGDEVGESRSKINQAQAQQALGLYRQSQNTLEQVKATLENQPDTLLKAITLRSLGQTLRVVGQLEESCAVLYESLKIAKKIDSATDREAALLSLANTARYLSLRIQDVAEVKTDKCTSVRKQLEPEAQDESDFALKTYEEIAENSNSPNRIVQAQLNQLQLLIELGREEEEEAQNLTTEIEGNLKNLMPSRESVYAYIKYSQNLEILSNDRQINPQPELASAKLLATAVEMARDLNDERAESYALGNLGNLYEKTEQWSNAREITEQALILAQSTNAPEITYQWQWQLGRILQAKNDRENAIAAYGEAVNTLQGLRRDLVAINQDEQFSFRDRVELVYREYVELLLATSAPTQENLQQARKAIEGLQLAELDNFFRDACLDVQPKQIDEIDAKASVIYPIILGDRLEIVLSLPDKSLRHQSQKIPQAQIERMLDFLQDDVSNRRKISSDLFLKDAQKLYDWLIRPFETTLENNEIETLVFVLDGVLRNIPMSVLHDGEQYLIENYAIALTPGLQLLRSQGLQTLQIQALTAGLSEARQGFSALENVEEEIEQINTEFPAESLLNAEFTKTKLQTLIDLLPFPVVHIATHGQFGSVAEDTFILTYNDRLNSKELGNILQPTDPAARGAIELLVLSACETATGDQRAGLGLAGVAVRSEARSTVATLWQVNDKSSAQLMVRFYQELAQGNVTKGEALRRAQVSILRDRTVLENPQYAHPYFWAAYVLVGNWL